MEMPKATSVMTATRLLKAAYDKGDAEGFYGMEIVLRDLLNKRELKRNLDLLEEMKKS